MMKGKVEKVEKQGKDEGRGMKKVQRGFFCS